MEPWKWKSTFLGTDPYRDDWIWSPVRCTSVLEESDYSFFRTTSTIQATDIHWEVSKSLAPKACATTAMDKNQRRSAGTGAEDSFVVYGRDYPP